MTNLDSILKSKGISLPTKVCLVKAMVFPIVIYGCENWTINKAVSKNWYFWMVVLEKTLETSWTARKSNQSVLKEISPEYSLEVLMLKLKLQYFGHLIQRANSLENTLMLGKIEGRRRRGWQRLRWLDGHEFKKALGDGEGQGNLVCYSPWGCKESDTTGKLNNNMTIIKLINTSITLRSSHHFMCVGWELLFVVFSNAYETYIRNSISWARKQPSSDWKETNITQNALSNHSGILLEINKRKITGKSPNNWKWNDTFFSNP